VLAKRIAVHRETPGPLAPPLQRTDDALGTCRARVLLAEDDPALRELMAGALRRDGYEVLEASDGTELLDRLEAIVTTVGRGPDAVAVIISDIRMPGLTGLDLLAALRCAEWTTPVILITAFGDEETHREARELGARAVLDKPFPLEQLRAAVQEAVPRC